MKQRILQFIDYKGISKNKFYIETGLSNGILDKNSGFSMDTVEKIYYKYPEINLEWLVTGKGEMLKPNIKQVQRDIGNNNTLSNINGKVDGDITIPHNEISDFIELHKEMNSIIKTTQNQLSESQKQVNILLEILKNSQK